MPESAASVVAAVLLGLAATFQTGLKHLEAKEHEPAVAAFTKVYEEDVPGNTQRYVALYFRAAAHHALDQKKQAFADLRTVVEKTGDSSLREAAKRDYLAWGGPPDQLRPDQSPKQVLLEFFEALANGNFPAAMRYCAGRLDNRFLQAVMGDEGFQRGRGMMMQDMLLQNERVGVEGDAQKAAVEMVKYGGREIFEVYLQLDDADQRWVITNVANRQRLQGRDIQLAATAVAGVGQVAKALAAYADKHQGNLPGDLRQLVADEFLADESLLWLTPPQGRVRRPLFYRGPVDGDYDAERTLAVLAPYAVQGRRAVGFADGRVELLPDEDVAVMLKDQGWPVAADDATDEKPTPETVAKVEALVKKLAAEDFQTRQEGRRQLLALGPSAYPVLSTYRDDPDPEVRLTIRGILGQ